ncbi:hypothetical protein D3218_08710 [Aureimonas flava]|uniref:Uncharacterized protein n=1 Tax=Aureimonas flava TaxID=2320271 RepID=A0A3A1WM32_9HYPH|nr:hypothetical protein D3218_08710 [Aureimonas flava]
MRRRAPAARIARTALAFALLTITVWLNATILIEAYGSGPPYHGRTANMDKWTHPLPSLISLDVVGILVVRALVYRTACRADP